MMRSVMPPTPCSSTSSAMRKASTMGSSASAYSSSRWLGMMMRVSTAARSAWMPCSAWTERRRPSKPKGRVTTATVRAPTLRATSATTGRRPGAGAAPFAGGDEDHVGPAHRLLDLGTVLLGRSPPDLGVGAGPQAAGQVAPDVELDVGVRHQQGLGIGVDRHELHAAQPGLDHPVDGVDPAPAHADHLDDGEVGLHAVRIGCHHSRALALTSPVADAASRHLPEPFVEG